MPPYTHSGIFLATINTACRWSKLYAKKNLLFISKVVTFEAIPKFWGTVERIKWCKKSTRWTRSRSLPIGFDVMDRCYFSISSSSCCCIIVENLTLLMIICSFLSISCTYSYLSCCSAKASWAYLDITALSSGVIDIAIAAYHSWGELIYHLFGTYFLQYIFDR